METPNKKLLRAENNGIQRLRPIEIPNWFFNTNQVEIWTFKADGGKETKDMITIKDGAYIVVNDTIVATVLGPATIVPTQKVDW